MTTKAAIFDLDGTLLDTLNDLRNSLESALKKEGFSGTFDDHTFKHMVGNGLTKLIKRSLPSELDEDSAPFLRVRSVFKDIYSRNLLESTRPYPGIGELVTRLKAAGFRLGVWSNKDDDNTRVLIEHFFPEVFTAIMGAVPGRPIKPAPQAGLELAELLGAKPEEIYYLGDSEVDMETAKGCGFIAIGVSWGFRSKEVLVQAGARVILDKPDDLHSFLESVDGQPR
ncbi:MAG: HAD family hydrolase [Deltaproteobacteria bacterium]|jgi:phosphoglycolate phosphatase|nr:HAD family hydrolase [Deltaproteobacteria bacterium]